MLVGPLTRPQIAAAIEGTGWCLFLEALAASIRVTSLREGIEAAALVQAVCGDDADEHLRLDLRSDRVELRLQTMTSGVVAARDLELAHAIADAIAAAGHPLASPAETPRRRAVQAIEVAIDATDIDAVRPFWKAVLAYVDEPGPEGAELSSIVDPAGQGPNVWFQPMETPRPQRNRIHFDVIVSPEEAPARIEAALAAGGTLLRDTEARAFWVLADPEGNEVCVCTWQDRD